jgi:hypothetical protein
MRLHRLALNAMGALAFLLGQASALWGLVLAPAYWLGFAVLLPHGRHGASATGLALPMLWPVVGLALGGLGLLLSRHSRARVAGLAVAGLVLNAMAPALAMFLRSLG